MNSAVPKVLHEVLFKPMLYWGADAAVAAGAVNVCVGAAVPDDAVAAHVRGVYGERCTLAFQGAPHGTGHAVMQAEKAVRESGAEDVLVLCGDAPLVDAASLQSAWEQHRREGNAATVLTAELEDPTGYGRILREGSEVAGIVEERDASEVQKAVCEINSGVYWFRTQDLLEALGALTTRNAQGEYYLTDTVRILRGKERRVGAFRADARIVAGANDRRQLMRLGELARGIVFERLFEAGVTILDPAGVLIGPDVLLGRDTVVLPGTILRGRTVAGCGCVLGPNALLEDCVLGDNVTVNASQARRSLLEAGVTLGPFSHLRPGTVLHEKAHVGDFVEIKNSEIGAGTKVAHLTYVGDSDVGEGVNFGCGVVTANYDGARKFRTVIGNGAFIGCNTNLVAPVKVGDGAWTAAGSTVTRDVPAGALAVARAREEILPGWAERRAAKQAAEKAAEAKSAKTEK